uniref:anthranilate N-benzoyltransferase n=1 Tax=Chenopodium quinoa TaxID=63459 RepID=A0A803L628_CHEQI
MTISEILSPVDVPPVVQSLFDHDRAVNHDGHKRPLLSIQVTELKDGVFIGCSMNHVVVDGTSYWHFWKIWSEIHRANGKQLLVSRLPNHKRWFPDGYGPAIPLPFTHPNEFVSRYEVGQLRERIFHFSPESIARLKAKANKESNNNSISSFQSLSALVWRSIVRANCLPGDQITNCRFAANNRQRLDPPLPPEYVGNCVTALTTTTTAGELLGHNLGWAASLLHQSVVNHSDKTVHKFIIGWLQSPFVYQPGKMFEPYSVMMGSSPRFDMYGNEFGLGKAVAVRSGYANKYVGKVTAYPGYEGGGSVDLEICLPPKSMSALESDEEFMSAATTQYNTTMDTKEGIPRGT